MSELSDEQITDLIQKERRSHGHVERNVARSAYALGREAGLKEAAAICENSPWHFSRDGLCASLANTIRERIATPSDSPADVKSDEDVGR